jgi:hypothetical protein
MATLVVIIILGLLFVYIVGNVRTLHYLSQDLKVIETQQQRRVQDRFAPPNQVHHTNAVAEPR